MAHCERRIVLQKIFSPPPHKGRIAESKLIAIFIAKKLKWFSSSWKIIFNEQSHLDFLIGKNAGFFVTKCISYCFISKTQACFYVNHTLKLTLRASKYMKIFMEFMEDLNWTWPYCPLISVFFPISNKSVVPRPGIFECNFTPLSHLCIANSPDLNKWTRNTRIMHNRVSQHLT